MWTSNDFGLAFRNKVALLGIKTTPHTSQQGHDSQPTFNTSMIIIDSQDSQLTCIISSFDHVYLSQSFLSHCPPACLFHKRLVLLFPFITLHVSPKSPSAWYKPRKIMNLCHKLPPSLAHKSTISRTNQRWHPSHMVKYKPKLNAARLLHLVRLDKSSIIPSLDSRNGRTEPSWNLLVYTTMQRLSIVN